MDYASAQLCANHVSTKNAPNTLFEVNGNEVQSNCDHAPGELLDAVVQKLQNDALQSIGYTCEALVYHVLIVNQAGPPTTFEGYVSAIVSQYVNDTNEVDFSV